MRSQRLRWEGKRRASELTRQAIGCRMLQLLALPLETAHAGSALKAIPMLPA
jgi:arsenate reductase (thioredoxin)